jgi:hypothetical protein
VATIWSPSRKRTKLPVCRIRSRSAPMQSLLGGIVRTKTVAQTRKDALTQLVPYEPPLRARRLRDGIIGDRRIFVRLWQMPTMHSAVVVDEPSCAAFASFSL